jgi:hypothetical protein
MVYQFLFDKFLFKGSWVAFLKQFKEAEKPPDSIKA